MTKLKSCPFCGAEASMFHPDSTSVIAFCGWCGAMLRDSNEEEVVRKWNRRVSRYGGNTTTAYFEEN